VDDALVVALRVEPADLVERPDVSDRRLWVVRPLLPILALVVPFVAAACGGGSSAVSTEAPRTLFPATANCGAHRVGGKESVIARTPYRDPAPVCRAIVKTLSRGSERWRVGYGDATGRQKRCRLIAPTEDNVALAFYGASDDLCEELEERGWEEEE
jgi:hypothetical protein